MNHSIMCKCCGSSDHITDPEDDRIIICTCGTRVFGQDWKCEECEKDWHAIPEKDRRYVR